MGGCGCGSERPPSIPCCSRDALGALVRERRRRLGVSQDARARACGLSTPYVQGLELGALRRLHPTAKLWRIAASLRVELREPLEAAGPVAVVLARHEPKGHREGVRP